MTKQAQVITGPGFAEVIFGPEQLISGQALAGTIDRWLQLCPRLEPVTGSLRDGKFILRLSRPDSLLLEALRSQPALLEGCVRPSDGPLDVLYCHNRVAVINPFYVLTVSGLTEEAARMQNVLRYEVHVRLDRNAILLVGTNNYGLQRDLVYLLHPRHQFLTSVQGVAYPGEVLIKFSVPIAFVLTDVTFAGLPFVMGAKVLPKKQGSGHRYPTMEATLRAEPSNVEHLWNLAAQIVMATGGYPIGEFQYKETRSKLVTYYPPYGVGH